jgi:hypothetical protein
MLYLVHCVIYTVSYTVYDVKYYFDDCGSGNFDGKGGGRELASRVLTNRTISLRG